MHREKHREWRHLLSAKQQTAFAQSEPRIVRHIMNGDTRSVALFGIHRFCCMLTLTLALYSAMRTRLRQDAL